MGKTPQRRFPSPVRITGPSTGNGGATPSPMRKIPQSPSAGPASSRKRKHCDAEEVQKCAICLEEANVRDLVYASPCGHFFCLSCIKEWATRCHSCPLCKRQMRAFIPAEGLPSLPPKKKQTLNDCDSGSEELPDWATGWHEVVVDEESESDSDPPETEVPWVRGARQIKIVTVGESRPATRRLLPRSTV